MQKICVNAAQAPEAIGPYSHAVKAGNLVFVSGQLPIDPASGQFSGPGAAEQASQCLKNLQAILEAAGSSLDQVVKTQVFLVDMADFAEVNQAYAACFSADAGYPARSCFAVRELPKGARVEIEAVAVCA